MLQLALILTKAMLVPKEVMRPLIYGLAQVEEALATIEELSDKKGMERIKEARDEYRKGEIVEIENGDAFLKLP
jgi:hypothetical protein